MNRICTFLLALLLCLNLSGCGEDNLSAFRALETLGTRSYSVICRKGDRIFPLINAAMNRIAAGNVLTAVSSRWLGRNAITLRGADDPGLPTPDPEEDARTLIIGVEADFPPMAYEVNGTLQGMSIDIGLNLGQTLGWSVSFQPISPGEVGTQLASGNIDCALGFDPGTVDSEKFDVGVTYMESDIVLAVRQLSDVKRMRDLRDRRVGAIDDPVIVTALRENDTLTRYASGATLYPDVQQCLSALDSGWCSAIAVDRMMLEHI